MVKKIKAKKNMVKKEANKNMMKKIMVKRNKVKCQILFKRKI